jgi:hypothetical protein
MQTTNKGRTKMKALLVMIMLNGTIKTKQLPTMGICEQVKVEVTTLANVKKTFCAEVRK